MPDSPYADQHISQPINTVILCALFTKYPGPDQAQWYPRGADAVIPASVIRKAVKDLRLIAFYGAEHRLPTGVGRGHLCQKAKTTVQHQEQYPIAIRP